MRARLVLVPLVALVAVLAACKGEPAPTPAAPAPSPAPTHSAPAPSPAPATVEAAAADAAPLAPGEDPARTPDIEYVPTPPNVVAKMLEVAAVTKDDVVYDLGCGDGRIVIAAAKEKGARGFGFDIDPERVAESRKNVEAAGVGHLVTIEQRDIFNVDLSPASVVTLYLLPELNVRLIPQLQKLKDGARIVSHDFDMKGVQHEDVWTVMAPRHRPPPGDREHYVYLWRAPIKAPSPEPAPPSPVDD